MSVAGNAPSSAARAASGAKANTISAASPLSIQPEVVGAQPAAARRSLAALRIWGVSRPAAISVAVNKIAPFPTVMEGSDKRYLTGADFDIESVQPVADGFWLGDEFGPYLLKFDTKGQLTDVIPTTVDGKPVISPDNALIQLPGTPVGKNPVFNLKRSGGFEGLAMSKDGSKLYGLLEGALYQDDGKMETVDGHTAIRVIEFDVASKKWTGRS